MNIVFLNGEFLPAAEARVSIFDRSFLLGDGLFETIRVYHGKTFRWSQHLARLQTGAALLGIRVPLADAELTIAVAELLRRNGAVEAILRIHLSRGIGRRGYSPRGADSPVLVMTVHEATAVEPAKPTRWRVTTSSYRFAARDRLAVCKSASKLLNVIAKAEAEERGFDEALLLNAEGQVVEGAGSNVFWLERDLVCTPSLTAGALAGVTRALILELLPQLGLAGSECECSLDRLKRATGVFLTSTALEMIAVTQLDDTSLPESPLRRRIHEVYQAAVRAGL